MAEKGKESDKTVAGERYKSYNYMELIGGTSECLRVARERSGVLEQLHDLIRQDDDKGE